jgi:hypothetical protein
MVLMLILFFSNFKCQHDEDDFVETAHRVSFLWALNETLVLQTLFLGISKEGTCTMHFIEKCDSPDSALQS